MFPPRRVEQRGNGMYTSLGVAAMLVALLVVMVLQRANAPASHLAQVLIILLVAIAVL
jgi:hypothetical protein